VSTKGAQCSSLGQRPRVTIPANPDISSKTVNCNSKISQLFIPRSQRFNHTSTRDVGRWPRLYITRRRRLPQRNWR